MNGHYYCLDDCFVVRLFGEMEEKMRWVKEEKDWRAGDSMHECAKIEVFTDKRNI